MDDDLRLRIYPDTFDPDELFEERLGLSEYLERENVQTGSRLLAGAVIVFAIAWYLIQSISRQI